MIYLWTWFAISYGLGGWWACKIARRWPKWFRAEGWGSVIAVLIMSPFVVPIVLLLDLAIWRGWIPEPDMAADFEQNDQYEDTH